MWAGLGGEGHCVFHKREVKPRLYTRAGTKHQSGHGHWFLSWTGLGLAGTWSLCMALTCTGPREQFVLTQVCGAVSSGCSGTVAP